MIRSILCTAAALVAALPAYTQQFTPFDPTGIYDVGERAGWNVAGAGRYMWTAKRNNSDVVASGTLDLTSGNGVIETSLDRPGMLYVEVRPEGDGKPIHLGAAVAPEKLKPPVERPADFDRFWNAKLKDLKKVPINPVVEARPTTTPGIEQYAVTLDSLGSKVRAYLAKPAKPGKFPALVIYQYAGVYAIQPQWSAERAAEGWLCLNVSSHDMPLDQGTGVPNEYQHIGSTSRETAYFLNMYLRDVRALDYIASRPDWDGRTLVVTGTSMGGQQSLVAAGLDDRITAVIVNEPAGADGLGDLHGRKAGYPFWRVDDPQVRGTAPYFDVINFARRIKAPTLIAVGFIDTITPPVGIWTAYNELRAPKEIIPMIESDHNNLTPDKQEAFHSRAKEVFGLLLRGEKFQPEHGPVR